MKINIERIKLLKAMDHANNIVERRNTIPVLANVLIVADKDGMRLTTTDLDIQLVEQVEAEILTEGRVTVHSQTLYDIVRKMPVGSQIQLSAAEGRLAVVAGRSRFQLGTLPADDFPIFPGEDLPAGFTMDAKRLHDTIDRARFAMSSEATRYYLNGIYMEVVNNELHAVATDGHRLAYISMEKPENADGLPDVIVPSKCINELTKMLNEIDGDVEVSMSAARIRFGLGRTVLTAKLIDGTFPDYRRVIPTNNQIIVTTNTAALKTAIDRVSTVATEKTRAVKFNTTGDGIELSVTSPENGTAREDVAARIEGGSIEIGFNSRYLIDILNEITDEEVEFQLSDAAGPVLIRGRSEKDTKMVIMPMRV